MDDVPVLQLTISQALRVVRDPTWKSVVTLRQDLTMITDGNGTDLGGRIL
jgi:hypothetical protein